MLSQQRYEDVGIHYLSQAYYDSANYGRISLMKKAAIMLSFSYGEEYCALASLYYFIAEKLYFFDRAGEALPYLEKCESMLNKYEFSLFLSV